MNAGSPQLCKEMHTHVWGSGFPWPVTAGLERAQASQLLGSHYEITPVRNCTLIRYGRCCEYWCFFVVCEQLFPSLLLTVLPVPSVPVQTAVTFPLLFFLWFFFSLQKHTCFNHSSSYLSQSLLGLPSASVNKYRALLHQPVWCPLGLKRLPVQDTSWFENRNHFLSYLSCCSSCPLLIPWESSRPTSGAHLHFWWSVEMCTKCCHSHLIQSISSSDREHHQACLCISIHYWMMDLSGISLSSFSLSHSRGVTMSVCRLHPLHTGQVTQEVQELTVDLQRLSYLQLIFVSWDRRASWKRTPKPWPQSWRVILVVQLALGEGQWIPQI